MAKKKPKRWTEKRWLTATDTQEMLKHLGDRATDRKLRLFSCACCRQAWGFVRSTRLKEILPLLEDFADGKRKDQDRARVCELGAAVLQAPKLDDMQQCLGGEFWRASQEALDRSSWYFGDLAAAAYGYANGTQKRFTAGKNAERKRQAPLVRELFGNPFQPVKFSASWRTDTAKLLAAHIYESREFSAMPILADALQDAGCDNDELLNHLRDTTVTHYRGCWVLDLVLEKQ